MNDDDTPPIRLILAALFAAALIVRGRDTEGAEAVARYAVGFADELLKVAPP